MQRILEYIKPLTASGFSYIIAESVGLNRPEVVYIITDLLKITASIAGIIYTIVKTYVTIKEYCENERKNKT